MLYSVSESSLKRHASHHLEPLMPRDSASRIDPAYHPKEHAAAATVLKQSIGDSTKEFSTIQSMPSGVNRDLTSHVDDMVQVDSFAKLQHIVSASPLFDAQRHAEWKFREGWSEMDELRRARNLEWLREQMTEESADIWGA